ncbi:myelin-oligodendrocyte glycoprotein-like [Platysternon megacephalum]|uniref:Myelin-oligodendrocyte glycoprotein-like n=1 Tax=Platysternon megacephalum TaxID=55544 RepID=A0A4D9EK25_9SAUR|nr:myelin-oligodendrocyte glycoprotein-like [Platysternon megacephalum]
MQHPEPGTEAGSATRGSLSLKPEGWVRQMGLGKQRQQQPTAALRSGAQLGCAQNSFPLRPRVSQAPRKDSPKLPWLLLGQCPPAVPLASPARGEGYPLSCHLCPPDCRRLAWCCYCKHTPEGGAPCLHPHGAQPLLPQLPQPLNLTPCAQVLLNPCYPGANVAMTASLCEGWAKCPAPQATAGDGPDELTGLSHPESPGWHERGWHHTRLTQVAAIHQPGDGDLAHGTPLSKSLVPLAQLGMDSKGAQCCKIRPEPPVPLGLARSHEHPSWGSTAGGTEWVSPGTAGMRGLGRQRSGGRGGGSPLNHSPLRSHQAAAGRVPSALDAEGKLAPIPSHRPQSCPPNSPASE